MQRSERQTVQIGTNELEASVSENPIDGFRFTVEANGDPKLKIPQLFYPTQLTGVKAEQFPDSLDLHIYNVSSGFRFIDMVSVTKLEGNCFFKNWISFGFQNWDLGESLGSFIDRYADALRNSSLKVKVETYKDEYGYSMISTIPVAPEESIYDRMSKLEELQETTYRKQLLPSKTEESKKYGEERIHWWIRYVIVPLVCSGAAATVIGAYLLR